MRTRQLWRIRPRVEELEGRWVPATLSYSTNWAGYAVSAGGGSVSRVAGLWVVPPAATSSSGYSSAWVGIDGFNSSTVEQIGTDSDYVGGVLYYYAWYEMYPAGPVNLSLTVQPGDTISASVSYASGVFTLAINNVSRPGQSFSINQTASSAARSSAEWIQEAPSSFNSVLPLANFGTINFSGAQATVGSTTGPVDGVGGTVNQINMVNSSNSPKATTSALTDSGNPATSSFSVSFVSSGSSGGRHGKHAANVQPDPTVAAQISQSQAATAQALAQATPLVPRLAVPSTAVVVPAAPSLFAQTPVTIPNHFQDTTDTPTTMAGGQAVAPELLPPPAVSDGPDTAPARPDAAAPAPADPAPPTRPGAALDPGRMGDDTLGDGRWEPAAPVQATPAPAAGTGEDAVSVESAGLALTLALGGTWGIAMRETAARRRRPQLGRV